jgi:hypothetical protein
MVVVGVGCASKNDSLGGTGGNGTGGGGTGGLSCGQTDSCGGTVGTGGGTGGGSSGDLQAQLTAAEETWAATKPNCPIYVYQTQRSSVFGSCSTTTNEIANDQLIRSSYATYDNRSCTGTPTTQGTEVGAQLPDAGTPPTVEQLFAQCQALLTQVAGSPSSYTGVSFVFNAQGVPENCLATNTPCEDDCTDGIDIQSFMCEASPSFDAGLNPG